MFKLSFYEGLKNIDKNKYISYLIVFLFAFLFILESYTFSYYKIAKEMTETTENDTFKESKLYILGSKFNIRHQQLMEPSLFDNEAYETIEFFAALDKIEHLHYMNIEISTIGIMDEFKGDLADFKYIPPGDPNYYDDKPGTYVKAAYVFPTFRTAENYRIIKGRDFTEEDLVYEEGKPFPCLLGYKYKDVYEPGDIIEAKLYMSNLNNFDGQIKVIGIMGEDTEIISGDGMEFYDLDDHIVIPQIFITYEQYLEADEKLKSLAVNAKHWYFLMIKTTVEVGYEDEVIPQLQEALNNYSGFAKYYKISERSTIIEMAQEKAESLSSFYLLITGVLGVFSILTLIILIVNKVARNVRDYAIHIAVGASPNSVIGFIIAELSVILIFSAILGFIFSKIILSASYMYYDFIQFLLLYTITALVVFAVSAVTAKLALKKYDVCSLIK